MRVAEKNAKFEVGEKWRCQCGKEHEFGAWVAAHWNEALTHTCSCGRARTWRSGLVLKIEVAPGVEEE